MSGLFSAKTNPSKPPGLLIESELLSISTAQVVSASHALVLLGITVGYLVVPLWSEW